MNTSAASALVQSLCVHCGNEIPARSLASARFCCRGCETVFELLKARGLENYYEIRAKGRPLRKASPVGSLDDSFVQLDDPEFQALYTSCQGGRRSMHFYLEGVHCAACVWLTERVGEFVASVESVRLNLGNSVASVTLSEAGSFAAVAREFSGMGYRPHPVRLDGQDEVDQLQRKADRLLLARTGVAGACAGNIMLLAVSLYAGADGSLAHLFRWASAGLSLPVLLFSAAPFYQSALRAIRSRQVSIDIPIALGIAIGALSSFYNLAIGSEYLYFDSLSSLVFLMLASRYLLRKTQQAALDSSRLIHFLMPSCARVREPGGTIFREVPVDRVVRGDVVEVFVGECVPVDGVVLSGQSAMNHSLLTGEFRPVIVSEGAPVFAGTVNQGAPLQIRATASGVATRLGQTLSSVQADLSKKASIVSFADRVSQAFVTAVLISVVIVFLVGLRSGLHEAVNLALALSIVTCPCAFALATPLALSLAMGRCAREGILIKGADVLERLSQVEEVFFDKTGTLTHGNYTVQSWDLELSLDTDPALLAALVALETKSRHPVAHALVEHFRAQVMGPLPEVSGFQEVLGRGVSGRIGGRDYEMTASRGEGAQTEVSLWRDGKKLGSLRLGDEIRPEAPQALDKLARMGVRAGILSGDSAGVVSVVARKLGIMNWRWRGGLSPEQKREEILPHPRALMVGDGANDANALAAAYVSIAVHGGMEVSLHSADAYCRKPGIKAIPELLVVARETMRLIHRNFAFSLVYNLIGIIGVIGGWVTPLFAAVLMPISAVTVFLSSLIGTRKLRLALREMGT